jgi:predicted enzyme related to lactoylglutathione lyase
MAPTMANGKICYLEIPALQVQRSADFYTAVFGWKTRRRGDGSLAFDDGVGEVSGTWVLGRAPNAHPGLLVYIMVDDINATIEKIKAQKGDLVQPVGADHPEITARFRDPGGNIVGLYQQQKKS